jgi:hypothetical protein
MGATPTEFKVVIHNAVGSSAEIIKYNAKQEKRAMARADKAWYNQKVFSVRVQAKHGSKWIDVSYRHRN